MRLLNSMQQGFIGWFDRNNNASFLFATAAIGWVLASAAQTFGILKSKELTKEDKKFLVPQEIMDGTANIAMYAAVTTNLMKAAEKSCMPGKNGKAPFISLKDASGKILDYSTNMAEYAKTGRNLKTGAAILGGIISTCILTPITRNAAAAFIKKQADKKKDEVIVPTNIYGRTQPFFTKTYPAPQTGLIPQQTAPNKFAPMSTYPHFSAGTQNTASQGPYQNASQNPCQSAYQNAYQNINRTAGLKI